MRYKYLLLATCLLWGNCMIHAQWKRISAIPNQQQTGISRIVQKQDNGKVLYGYCAPGTTITEKNGIGFPTIKDIKVSAAIRFSEGLMNLVKGRNIYRIRIGVAANIESATVFIRQTDGTPLQEINTALKLGWNDITLDSPLEIPTANELYIGYTCTQKPDECVIASANGSAKINGMLLSSSDPKTLTQYNELGNLCISVEMDGSEHEFDYLGSLQTAYSSSPYLAKGENKSANINIYFFNEGEFYASRIKLGRSFNGTEIGDTICTFKRAVRENNIGKLTLNVSPAETGKYTFTLKEVEGEPIAASSQTAGISVYDSNDAIERMVLAEEFTSQSCGNCPSGQAALHNVIGDNKDRVALVLHHSGYQPDIFTVKESDTYCYFYNSSETYAPAMMMNRTCFTEYDTSQSGSPVFDPRALSASKLMQELNQPAMVSIGINSSYDEATRQLSITVSGHKITELVGKHVGLTVFLLESKYEAEQGSANGVLPSFEHNDLLRCVLSDVKGDVITFNGYNGYSMKYTYTIPEEYTSMTGSKTAAHPENMNIVAFISNFDTVHPDNCFVLNANKTTSLNDEVNKIKNNEVDPQTLQVYVKDGTAHIDGEYNSFEIYNSEGMTVRNEGLIPGIYIIKIINKDNGRSVQKFFVR